MPSIIRKYSSGNSTSSSQESKSRHSSVLDAVTFSSQSTTPTSMAGSPRIPDSKSTSAASPKHVSYREVPRSRPPYEAHDEDLSPNTSCYPRSSVDTYVSSTESEEALEQQLPDGAVDFMDDDYDRPHDEQPPYSGSGDSIPPLPEYRHDIVDSSVRPSSPQEFAQLFPSLNRMSIRHDEFTADGNMNLRVDITVPVGSRRRPTSYQLFHLRMYDLAKREFSLRRYCRDSGREVCNSKLNFIDPSEKKSRIGLMSRKSSEEHNLKHWGRRSSGGSSNHGNSNNHNRASDEQRPTLQRSMTTALRTLGAMATKTKKPSFRRSQTTGGAALGHQYAQQRPATSYHHHHHSSYDDGDSEYTVRPASVSSSTPSFFGRSGKPLAPPPPPKPTNTIKLEFSNYARVDVERRHGAGGGDTSRYEFEWWGHKYTWKRVVEKHLNVVSYHLLRDDGGDTPVAHIVPEMRSPNQVQEDDEAGGWIPPCHMWISDPSVLEAMTDVADVIMATGLMSLVDDCIRTRWQPRKAHHHLLDMESVRPKALMQHVFHRRNSHSNGSNNSKDANTYTSSPLRHAEPI